MYQSSRILISIDKNKSRHVGFCKLFWIWVRVLIFIFLFIILKSFFFAARKQMNLKKNNLNLALEKVSGTPELRAELFDAKWNYFKAVVLWKAIVSTEVETPEVYAALTLRNILLSNMKNEPSNVLGFRKIHIDSYFLRYQSQNFLPGTPLNARSFDANRTLKMDSPTKITGNKRKSFQSDVMNSLKEYDGLFSEAGRNGYHTINRKFVENTNKTIDTAISIKKRIIGNWDIHEKQVGLYFSELSEAIDNLQRLTQSVTEELKLKPEKYAYVLLRCRIVHLKLRALKNSILVMTFTPDVLKCHRKIYSDLKEFIEENSVAIMQLEQNLSSYYFLGSSYVELVDEFIEIQHKIQKAQWSVNEIKEMS